MSTSWCTHVHACIYTVFACNTALIHQPWVHLICIKIYHDRCSSTAVYMYVYTAEGAPPLHLGRAPSSDCQPLQCSACLRYQNQRITASSNATFVAHIGPAAAQRGYMAITGEMNLLLEYIPPAAHSHSHRYSVIISDVHVFALICVGDFELSQLSLLR